MTNAKIEKILRRYFIKELEKQGYTLDKETIVDFVKDTVEDAYVAIDDKVSELIDEALDEQNNEDYSNVDCSQNCSHEAQSLKTDDDLIDLDENKDIWEDCY